MSQKPLPRKLWYFLAGGLCLLGPAIIAWGIISSLGDLFDMPVEFTVPGSAVFHAQAPGRYKVFLLGESMAQGEYRSQGPDAPEGLVVNVVRKADGQKVPLSPVAGRETFSSGVRSGTMLFAFQAEQPGDYVVSGHIARGGGEPASAQATDPTYVPAVLGVGEGIRMGSFLRIGLAAIGGGLVFLAGIVVLTITLIRRYAARSRAASVQATAPNPAGLQ